MLSRLRCLDRYPMVRLSWRAGVEESALIECIK